MKQLRYLFTCLIVLGSCSGNSESTTENDKNTKNATQVEENNEKQHDDTDVNKVSHPWSYYYGTIGLNDQLVVMELYITDSTVTGGYWYAKHQKRLNLEGEFDQMDQKYRVKESYKGKHTGTITFRINEEGDLVGRWYAPKSTGEGEAFYVRSFIKDSKERIEPEFAKYEYEHTITMYNGEEEGETEEDASDICLVTRLNDLIVFNYSVIGRNAHTGYVDGTAILDGKSSLNKGTALFKGESECELRLIFSENSIEIDEVGDCSYYRGFNAYFGGELDRVK